MVGAWSRIVGSVAVSAGRYRSNGGGSAGPGQLGQHRLGELGSARCLLAGDDEALDLRGLFPRRAGRGSGGQHNLRQPGPVADDEKCDGFQLAAAVQPAGDRDALADVLGQLGGQYS